VVREGSPTRGPERDSPLDAMSRSMREAGRRDPASALPPGARKADRATEQLRQEREAFEENKRHIRSWSRLRLSMGWTALVLLVVMTGVSSFVIVSHNKFPAGATTAAAAAVFAQTLALIAAAWHLVCGASQETLDPVIRDDR
jgi:hypothetical protein